MNWLDHPIAVGFFRDKFARAKDEQRISLRTLAALIRDTSASQKAWLPWLKLARVGDVRTINGSFRHDANILAVSGIEADYDGEQVSFDAAGERLKQRNVVSILYTSPSHTAERPRWRVLCPLAEEMAPDQRSRMLGRLNGLFDGIFAVESWTLSQAYYFGFVDNNPAHRVRLIDGEPIDQHDDLDVIWRGRMQAGHGGNATPQAERTREADRDPRKDAELIRTIVTGERCHHELVALAARYIGREIPAETTIDILRGVMLAHPEAARTEGWRDRFASIDDIVEAAVKKFAVDPAIRRKVEEFARRLFHHGKPFDDIRQGARAMAEQWGIDPDRADALAQRVISNELKRAGVRR